MVKKIAESVKDSAFLLRSIPYGDDHRVLSFLAEGQGRVDLIALGARKSIKRFSGLLDFVHCLRIEFQFKSRGGLPQLLHCELEEDFATIREDYEGTIIALKWLHLISRVLPEGQNVAGLFPLLREGLRLLSGRERSWVDAVFLRNLLSRLGFHLELSCCVRCRTDQSEAFYFDSQQGGLICTYCHPSRQGVRLGGVFTAKFWDGTAFLNAEEQALQDSRHIFESGFRDYLGVEINEKDFSVGV